MWLYTINVWWAAIPKPPTRDYTNVLERVEARVYRGASLNDGLALLAAYDRSCKTSVTEYRLLSVERLPDDTDMELLSRLGVFEIRPPIH